MRVIKNVRIGGYLLGLNKFSLVISYQLKKYIKQLEFIKIFIIQKSIYLQQSWCVRIRNIGFNKNCVENSINV